MSVQRWLKMSVDSLFFTNVLEFNLSIENPVEYEINNTIGTLNVLKCAQTKV